MSYDKVHMTPEARQTVARWLTAGDAGVDSFQTDLAEAMVAVGDCDGDTAETRTRDPEVEKEVQEALQEIEAAAGDILTDEEKEVLKDLVEVLGDIADEALEETKGATRDMEEAIKELEEVLKEQDDKNDAVDSYDRAMNIFD